jgi:hypothetical protein
LLFYEYFHGDNGAGIGASHQTGWTGLVARSCSSTTRRQRRFRSAAEPGVVYSHFTSHALSCRWELLARVLILPWVVLLTVT